MALSDSRWQRTLTLCALYVAQGVPWGFMLLTLPNYLIDEYGLTTKAAGVMTAWILVPWSFKLLWAPLMDTYTIRSMGRRRPWIIGAELMMAVTLLGFVGLGNPSQNLQLIIVMYVLHNCFASLQDVCTDALAVDILPLAEYGQMNGLMWGSKLVGKGVGAWGLSLVIDWGGLEACVVVQIVILLGIVIIPVLILERPGEKRFPWSRDRTQSEGESLAESQPVAENVRKPREVLTAYLKAFSLTTMLVFVAFTLSKLIGAGVYEIVRKTLYIEHLGWSHYELTTATGAYATIPIILGSIGGGILADRYGRRLILCVGFGGFGLVAMIYAACPGLWHELWFSMSYLLLSETLNAIASVGFLSLAMRISWTKSAAIVFTTYMTLSNVSHVIGNAMSGWVQEFFEYPDVYGESATMVSFEFTFWFVGVTTLLPLALLRFVRVEQVDRAREADESLRSQDAAGATV